MKDLITDLRKDIPKIRENIFGAIKRSDIQGWNIQDNTYISNHYDNKE